ncbi:hypothetical protein [Streptosporangium sp. NPDC051022]|uniref:hypothetical protein n=1 Tax=Streptosporangium sp. NPDC051022 TaxID=3155752 RepID=UPI00341C5558
MVAALLSADLLVAGCSAALQVNPAALDDVRGIGKVLGEVTTEGIWSNTKEVINKLAIDTGSANSREAINKAGDLLRKRKWVAVSQSTSEFMQMKSTVWDGVYLTIFPFDSSEIELYPEKAQEAIKKASAGSEALLAVSVGQEK